MLIYTDVTYAAEVYGTREYDTAEVLSADEEDRLRDLVEKENKTTEELDEMHELISRVLTNGSIYDEWEDDVSYYELIDEEFRELD
jgi:hypothetical protein